jgi:hypothetical protein
MVEAGNRFCGNCAAELIWDLPPQIPPMETITEMRDNIKPREPDSETVTDRPHKPRRNIIPLIIIVVLIVVLIIAIFAADIFLNF